jgi:hypothetical protein
MYRAIASLAVFLCSAATSAQAQVTDRALLATFCDAADIKGATCRHAKSYPNAPRRGCDVTLSGDRFAGRFVASANPLLIASYQSGCESHATDDGGSIVFEQVGGSYLFKSFQPGKQAGDCVVLTEAPQDRLVCRTGHMGQGILETGVALMNFAAAAGGRITLSLDMLLMAEDSIGAYGANVVTCKARLKYFGVSKLSAGPRKGTVSVEAGYADASIIGTACGKGFEKPEETSGQLAPGDAYVPEGREKTGRVVIDLVTRKATLQ